MRLSTRTRGTRRTIAALAGLLLGARAEAGGAVLWQGFEQTWGYNHRINRLGDRIARMECGEEGCEALHVHAGASGLGPDALAYAARYAAVFAAGVEFQAGELEIRLRGREGEALARVQEARAPAAPAMRGRGRYEAALGGFDLRANGAADKIQHLGLAVGEPRFDLASGELALDVAAALRFGCDTPECPRRDESVDYTLVVSYVVVGADGDALRADRLPFASESSWRGRRPEAPPEPALLAAAPEPAAYAFRALAVTLDDFHHLCGWSTLLLADASAPPRLLLAFAQWRRGMKLARPLPSLFAAREPGSARFEGEIARFSFPRGARVAPGWARGTQEWRGRNAPADTPDAVRETRLRIAR